MSRKAICIIPSRSGSKGLADKNIRLLSGKPLLAWPIEAAIKSQCFEKIVVSTDSEKYAEIAINYGAEVPFIRSPDLATDSASSIDVCSNVIDFYQNQDLNFDFLCLLEPTSPLTTPKDIIDSFQILVDSKHGRSIVGVGIAETSHPKFLCSISEQGLMQPLLSDRNDQSSSLHVRRQDLNDQYYFFDGSIYLTYTSDFQKLKTFYHEKTLCKIFSKFQNFEIDDVQDFQIIDAIINQQFMDK